MPTVLQLLPTPDRVAAIRTLNDRVRHCLPVPPPDVPSGLSVCDELRRLEPSHLDAVIGMVRDFPDDAFIDDPFGEHACGRVVLLRGMRREPLTVWFAFTYLNRTRTGPSPDPTSVAATFRLLHLLVPRPAGIRPAA